MIERDCIFCTTHIYWNKNKGKFIETNSGIVHDKIACQNVRDNIKTGQEEVVKTEQEVKLENISLELGYKTLKNYDDGEQLDNQYLTPKSFYRSSIDERHLNYNKLGIEFRHCVKCNNQTEHKQTTNNVRKCLVCNTIQLGRLSATC